MVISARGSLPPWTAAFALAVTGALALGYLEWSGLLALALLIVLAHGATSQHLAAPMRRAALWALIAMSGLLAAHAMPGFNNPRLLHAFKFSQDSTPFTQYANLDKGCLGLILLAYFRTPLNSWQATLAMLRTTLPILLGTCAAVIALALALGHARFDPKLPGYTATFLFLSLFFTCVAEEALFRAVVQTQLASALAAKQISHAPWIALFATALLFGIAHGGGGWGYVLMATLAGLGYGYAMLRSGRVEAAILVHFGVNAVHFLGFSYPRLA